MYDDAWMSEPQERTEAEAFQLRMFELRMTRALERLPEVAIPADFAARMAQSSAVKRATLLREARLTTTRYGYRVGVVCLIVLVVLMLGFARLAVGGDAVWVGLEWALCAQFVGLALWFGWQRWRVG